MRTYTTRRAAKSAGSETTKGRAHEGGFLLTGDYSLSGAAATVHIKIRRQAFVVRRLAKYLAF